MEKPTKDFYQALVVGVFRTPYVWRTMGVLATLLFAQRGMSGFDELTKDTSSLPLLIVRLIVMVAAFFISTYFVGYVISYAISASHSLQPRFSSFRLIGRYLKHGFVVGVVLSLLQLFTGAFFLVLSLFVVSLSHRTGIGVGLPNFSWLVRLLILFLFVSAYVSSEGLGFFAGFQHRRPGPIFFLILFFVLAIGVFFATGSLFGLGNPEPLLLLAQETIPFMRNDIFLAVLSITMLYGSSLLAVFFFLVAGRMVGYYVSPDLPVNEPRQPNKDFTLTRIR